MSSQPKIKSFHRSLLLSIVGFSIVVLVISLSIISSLFIIEQKSQLQRDMNHWGKVIAQISINDIELDSHTKLHKTLSLINLSSRINYIHIYQKHNDSTSFFTSFNRSAKHPAIPDKIAQIETLLQPQVTEHFIELVTPIKKGVTTIGYVYMQASLERVNRLFEMFLLAIAVIVLAAFFMAILLSAKLTRKLSESLLQITDTIQSIAQQKDFTLRCNNIPLSELDSLALNVNIMLNRIEKHIKNISDKEQQITAKNTSLALKVTSRTDALKESNQELLSTLEKLHQFQGQLVESEKMASLGDMVAGVAHEVNTPIGLGITASTLLEDRLTEIKRLFDNKTLKSSQLKKFLNESQENIAIIFRNLERAAGLISSFKKVAVDQSNNDEVSVVIGDLINEILLTLAPRLKKHSCEIKIDCPKDLRVVTKSGAIYQVLINLIMNSIIHGFEDKADGVIRISVNMVSQQINLNYQDNGKGISPSLRHKVFDPFTTTKRGEGGSGLGLHLVYNLITQALGGSIQLIDDETQGATFEIYFPVK